jgi:hypothetical protein
MKKFGIVMITLILALIVIGGCTPEKETITVTEIPSAQTITTTLPVVTVTSTLPATTITSTVTKTQEKTIQESTSITSSASISIDVVYEASAKSYFKLRDTIADKKSNSIVVSGVIVDNLYPSSYDIEIDAVFYDASGVQIGNPIIFEKYITLALTSFELEFITETPSEVAKCMLTVIAKS